MRRQENLLTLKDLNNYAVNLVPQIREKIDGFTYNFKLGGPTDLFEPTCERRSNIGWAPTENPRHFDWSIKFSCFRPRDSWHGCSAE